MISKNRLKELAAYRLQKRCDEEAAFVVEGPKMGGEALLAGLGIRAVCALPRWLEAHGTACQARGAEVHEVSPADLERLSLMKNPSLVWMLLDRPPAAPPPAAPQGLTLVLDRIQDPGNLGTMLRTADWFGVRHV
ncbi:MAG: RNA methyltransferase, partial [Bacteroidales bacterium]|nr:RNA methyltransferase [Bacteroidales bacterium]